MNNTLPIGTFLQGGKYRIERFISSGGFGCTYEAVHVLLEDRIAIKEFFVKDFCNRDEQTCHVTVGTLSKKGLVSKLKRKFIEEARALSKLHHPGIVGIRDVFEENGTAYYVMDYVEGQSLADLLKREGSLSERRAVGYIRQVCEALQYVHSHNRLHLDLKPGNIMLDGSGRAVLIDFGASKQYDEEEGENTSSLLGKTPGFAPPEQMANSVVQFFPATDIYSLGATLYKLLTGVTPPDATLRISGTELAPLPSGVSASTRTAVVSALRLNKRERPQSVEAFLALLDGAGVSDSSESSPGSSSSAADDEATFVNVDPAPSPRPASQPSSQPAAKSSAKSSSKPSSQSAPKSSSSSRFPLKVAIGVGGLLVAALVIAIAAMARIQWVEGEGVSVEANSEDTINGHAYVDLGLSVKWATCNVGASSPEDYGNYYAWGETSTKSYYDADNSKTYGKNSYNYDIGGNASLDAARANWGGTWRLPTKAEAQELKDKCTWTWTTLGGKEGRKVTGPSGRSIFLPAAGFRNRASLYYAGSNGYYWTSTPDAASYAYGLDCGNSDRDVGGDYRLSGRTVRPVSE